MAHSAIGWEEANRPVPPTFVPLPPSTLSITPLALAITSPALSLPRPTVLSSPAPSPAMLPSGALVPHPSSLPPFLAPTTTALVFAPSAPRLADNPALAAALSSTPTYLVLLLLQPPTPRATPISACTHTTHTSTCTHTAGLRKALAALGTDLVLLPACPPSSVPETVLSFAREISATHIFTELPLPDAQIASTTIPAVTLHAWRDIASLPSSCDAFAAAAAGLAVAEPLVVPQSLPGLAPRARGYRRGPACGRGEMDAMGVAGEFFVGKGSCASLGEGGVMSTLGRIVQALERGFVSPRMVYAAIVDGGLGMDEPRRFCGMMELLRMEFEHCQARKKCGVVDKARSRF